MIKFIYSEKATKFKKRMYWQRLRGFNIHVNYLSHIQTYNLFPRSGLMLGIGCALTYHTGVQKLNRIVGNKKNASYNGLSLTGNSLGAIIVFWGISHLLKTSPFEGSLMTMACCTLALSMIFTLIYLIPQRYINHHECKSVSYFFVEPDIF